MLLFSADAPPPPLSMPKGEERVKLGGKTAISIPKIPSPAPNHRSNLISMDQQKKELPNSLVLKVAETTPTVALTRAFLSPSGGHEGILSYQTPLCHRRPVAAQSAALQHIQTSTECCLEFARRLALRRPKLLGSAHPPHSKPGYWLLAPWLHWTCCTTVSITTHVVT